MPRSAVVFEAHDYVEGEPNCHCADAAEHAPCATCGAGKDSYIHSEEGREAGALLTVVTATDAGSASEAHE